MSNNSICCPLPSQSAAAENWNSAHADSLSPNIMPTKTSRWGYLICPWNEKKVDGKILKHIYASCIDLINLNIFLDCSPKKIYVKCMTQLTIRPFFTLLKTLSHLSLGRIAYNLIKTVKGDYSIGICIQKCVRSLADIVRTPMFGLALIITSVAMLCLGIFNEGFIFDGRNLIGQIEQMSNWGECHSTWDTLAPCFQPLPVSFIQRYNQRNIDTEYDSSDPLQIQLSNYARARLQYINKNCEPFECGKVSLEKPYISPVLHI